MITLLIIATTVFVAFQAVDVYITDWAVNKAGYTELTAFVAPLIGTWKWIALKIGVIAVVVAALLLAMRVVLKLAVIAAIGMASYSVYAFVHNIRVIT